MGADPAPVFQLFGVNAVREESAACGKGVLRRLLPAWGFAAAAALLLSACAGDLGGEIARGGSKHTAMALGWHGSGAYLAGRFAQTHNDATAASVYLQQALAADPENGELLQRTMMALAADGRLPEAAVFGRRLLKYDPDAALAAMLVAEQEARAGNWADAETLVVKLPRRGINAAIVPLIVAWSQVGQGHTDAAIEALKPLNQNASYSAVHDFHAALIDDLAGRVKAADENYRAILDSTAGASLRTLEASLSFYRRNNRPERVKELLETIRRQHPEAFDILRSEDSRPLVASPAAGLAEAYFSASVTLRQGQAAELSLIFGRMALDLLPNLPSCQVLVADILQDMGRLKDANAIYASIDPTTPIYWVTQLRLASNLDALDDPNGALTTLEALSARHPERADALIAIGDLQRGHQHWAEAAAAYTRAVGTLNSLKREDWPLLYSRGIAYERAGQWPLAEADFLKALDLQPDEPHVLNYLGYSWIDKGINLERAQKMVNKAVEQLPDDGDIVDSQGWVYFRLGNYRSAVEILQKAVVLHPEEATINEHLGDALWMVGRKEEARYQWQRALNFNPEPDQKTELEKKLKSGLKKPSIPPNEP